MIFRHDAVDTVSCVVISAGVVVITTVQLYSTKPELRFCVGSNPARSMSEIFDGEYI